MQASILPTRRRVGPVVTLLLLAPIIVEFLFGSTHLSTFYLILPQIGVYGCGALIIRNLARRRGRGWVAIALMGVAFAIVLECLILQTALAPLFVAMDPCHIYGRALGVNWVYLLYALGYESLWAIVLPIQVSELLFPDRRDDLWLGRWGLVVASVVFLLASIATWYLWGQAVHKFVPGPGYQAPLLAIGLALLGTVALVAIALVPQTASGARPVTERRAPRPWLVGLAAFWLALFWFALVVFAVGVAPAVPAIAPAVVAFLLAALTFGAVRRWSSRSGWGDAHRLALVSGPLLASMLAGCLVSGVSLPMDWIGKLALDGLAIVGLIWMRWKIRRRLVQVASEQRLTLSAS
jgi:hypothetical protein